MTLEKRFDEAIDRLERCRRVRAELVSVGGCEHTIEALDLKIVQLIARRAILMSQLSTVEQSIEQAII